MNSKANRGKSFASYAMWLCVAFVIVNLVAGAATDSGEFVGKAVGMLFGAPVICGIAFLVGYLSGSKPESSAPSIGSAPVREPRSDRPATDTFRPNQAVSTSAPARVPSSTEANKATMSMNSGLSQKNDFQSPPHMDVIYEIIGREIDAGRVEKGLWTRLFAEMDGDETKVKVAYIKQRAERLIATERAQQEERRTAAQLAEIKLRKAAEAAASAAGAGLTVAKARKMLISAAESMRRQPSLRNALDLLELNGEDVQLHSQGWLHCKYQINRGEKTVIMTDEEIIRYAQDLAGEIAEL